MFYGEGEPSYPDRNAEETPMVPDYQGIAEELTNTNPEDLRKKLLEMQTTLMNVWANVDEHPENFGLRCEQFGRDCDEVPQDLLKIEDATYSIDLVLRADKRTYLHAVISKGSRGLHLRIQYHTYSSDGKRSTEQVSFLMGDDPVERRLAGFITAIMRKIEQIKE